MWVCLCVPGYICGLHGLGSGAQTQAVRFIRRSYCGAILQLKELPSRAKTGGEKPVTLPVSPSNVVLLKDRAPARHALLSPFILQLQLLNLLLRQPLHIRGEEHTVFCQLFHL